VKLDSKSYLGDGLYMEFVAPYEIIVTSENGIMVLDRVVFDERMVKQFAQRVADHIQQISEE